MEISTSKEQYSRLRNIFNVLVPFITGSSAGIIATTCVQPVDTIKVRMQLTEQGNGAWRVARRIVARDGFFDLYKGLSAGILRQIVYGTLRMGLFSTFEQVLQRLAREQGTALGFGGRAAAGISAGAIAAFVGNPTEVALIRMQADSMKPVEQRRHYTSAFNALSRISKEEGVLSLWNGSKPTIIRAMSTNFGQLACFSESKHQINQHTSLSPRKQTALAAFIAGVAGAVISLPFDLVKTRLQNQSMTGPSTGLPLYKGTADCFMDVIRREGPLRFYRDFWPYFLRIGPHS
jgi:solute carrier family 25 oxoglutarate transporter 11